MNVIKKDGIPVLIEEIRIVCNGRCNHNNENIEEEKKKK